MSVEEKASLVFIPFPIMSHLVAPIKTAKLLADRDQRLSITVLIMKLPSGNKFNWYTKNSSDSRINFVELERDESILAELMRSPKNLVPRFVESQKGPARDAVAKIMESQKSGRLAGIVVDMLCTTMIDVAKELGVPSYVYFICGSASLGLMLHLQRLNDDHNQDLTEYEDSDAVISVPTYANPLPARVLPSPVFDKESGHVLDIARRLRETQGIIVNTFLEFEPHAIRSLSDDEKIPQVYPVGPIIHDGIEETDEDKQKKKEIIEWLDKQPDLSVVFLCFGTMACFNEEQVKEIAVALENSGHGFLWSLKKPPPKEKMEYSGEYENPGEVLPEGFLERTVGIGKVIGWAPQIAVLSHPAVGGFVSHCGWNSTLESVWFGVPMAVWPLIADQQANAFQLVKDYEMAVEIKMDYRMNSDVIVAAEKIEKAIKQLMDPENEIRANKVKELKDKSRMALMKGGSSYNFLDRLINNFIYNIS